jgi:hypothetical protein
LSLFFGFAERVALKICIARSEYISLCSYLIELDMEFEGVVFKKLPVSKGVSARGEWQRQDVVFEVPSEFSRKICVTFFNKPTEADSLVEGQTYIVSVNVESREYNGKWYTDVRAWRVQPKQEESAPAADAAPMPDMPPIG